MEKPGFLPCRRVEVLVDGPLMPRIVAAAEAAGIRHHMVLPTLGGLGGHGRWRRDEVTGTTAKQLFVALVPPAAAEALEAALAPWIESYDLMVVESDARMIGG